MATATRIETDMSGWPPVTRHYQVDGGHLAVTVLNLFGVTSTKIFYADETGGAMSTVPVMELPDGTTYDEALQAMGYDVVDSLAPEPDLTPDPEPEPEALVLDLPPEIAVMVAAPPTEPAGAAGATGG